MNFVYNHYIYIYIYISSIVEIDKISIEKCEK